MDRIAAEIKSRKTAVYDADLFSYFDTIPHDKLFLALHTRVTDGGVLSLIRQWLKSALALLGYEFRKVRDRHYLTGKRYLEYGPSAKSVKTVCAKIREETNRHRLPCPADKVIERLNLVLDGWGRYFKCGYPSRQFAKVNAYVRMRLYKFLNRKSQRGYRLKYAKTYYGEYQKLGLVTLARRRYYR